MGGYGEFCSLPAGWWMFYVRHWILLLALCFTAQAKAEIYKCKDVQGNIIYQQTPCPNGMIGKIEPPPPVPETDRQRAQERMERMIETSRQQDIAREQVRQKQAEQARLLAEQEEARLEAEREAQLRLEQEYRETHFLNMGPQTIPWPNSSTP